ncbi:MAG: lasso peptide biosynthesis PqqD family chaperone [Roseofilum sp. SBFL]|uniref:lasso peptide biosynthesis PqqD family chaperone n=1 Tax=unclassified Roseofilum TaxID=2620099 RepID=UPI001B010352|nr:MULTISPECIES: lasso peptide biosynthesis PqqD family chaperone [unclassified Roseofilum]MBP0011911.1 lasso peptide biosynthesis PqqD family chaperone [Roseofilum sp. SID3]MBP0022467.1 lasso peptide biosynthesis PqqD family chaperone [Roseofilum sp. SID2]MBP0037408.1 lasso peptide biosynthesis PqqD family chaperone [Roseofilum sp. SID1]MBP0044803.1 lasso peptide biosynthesis PqqD family chaperone [Roseofilum sp. SBFL]
MGSNQTITLTQKLVRNPDILASNLEDELVMMNIESDSYYGTNPVGTRIWELLEQPVTVSELCGLLQEEFDVDDQTCQQDVLPFIQKIVDEKLVSIIEE